MYAIKIFRPSTRKDIKIKVLRKMLGEWICIVNEQKAIVYHFERVLRVSSSSLIL